MVEMDEMDEKTLESGWVRWRHEFHRFPETGFNERSTSDRIARVLQMLGLEGRALAAAALSLGCRCGTGGTEP